MEEGKVILTGAPLGYDDKSPPRLPIFDVVKNPKYFSLLVQGLNRMQQDDQSIKHPKSHYQLGGIHGLPNKEWNGAGTGDPDVATYGGGSYCSHGTVLFPTWHRPYVALYEQILQKHVLDIAKDYKTTDATDWLNTANEFRLPYWDWASQAVPPDQVLRLEEVPIQLSDGKTLTVKNPLYAYKFNPAKDGTDGGELPDPYNTTTTLRSPDKIGAGKKSDPDALKKRLTKEAGQYKRGTHNLLLEIHDWEVFSNHGKNRDRTHSGSLESIHDSIHGAVGGDNKGHMGNPWVAGFDPIFFLHHCNVDRLLSLWQAINYKVFVPTLEKISPLTPLAPFWRDEQTFWNSTECKSHFGLKYTYPDFDGLDLNDPEKVKTALEKLVEEKYGSTLLPRTPHNTRSAAGAEETSRGPSAIVELAASTVGKVLSIDAEDGDRLVDWRVNIITKKFVLGGPYSIIVFLGQVPEDPNTWRDSPSYVGSFEVFANSEIDSCPNCLSNSDQLIEGVVYLNDALERSDLSSYDNHAVTPYLVENLHWMVKQDGQSIDIPSKLPDLRVTFVEVPIIKQYGKGTIIPHLDGNISVGWSRKG